MKIAICTNQKDGAQLKAWLRLEADADCFSIYLFQNRKQLLDSYSQQCFYDLIFIDYVSGLEFAQQLQQIDCCAKFIFLLQPEQPIWPLFEIDGVSLLLQPLQRVAFHKIFLQCRNIFLDNNQEVAVWTQNGQQLREKVVFTAREILYIESQSRKVYIQTIYQKRYALYGRISELEAQLQQHGFFRVHKSYLVNLRYVFYVSVDSILLRDPLEHLGLRIPLARRKRETLKELFQN